MCLFFIFTQVYCIIIFLVYNNYIVEVQRAE